MARKDNEPDTYQLMPEALDFLVKRGGEVKKEDLARHLATYIQQNGMGYRKPSIDWAPNRLCRAGLVDHPRHGYWAASDIGTKSNPLSL
jgi:restriction endonuclease Mrr